MNRNIAVLALGLAAALVSYAAADLPTAHARTAPQAKIESRETIEGELEVISECEGDKSRTLYFVKTGKERIKVNFATPPTEDLVTGKHVTLSGFRRQDQLASGEPTLDLASSSDLTNGQTSSLTSLSNTVGEQKVLVILVNFQDDTSLPFTTAQAADVTFNTASDFFRENSYGQTWLTGDVYGWYTIPVSSTSCDTTAIATYAKQAATNAGANLSAYSHYVYAFPQISACTFSGRSSIGGNPSQSWINTDWFSIEVLGHELGHGFGLLHSHSMDCGSLVVGSTCTINEYGDKFDILGASMPVHFNLFQKERLGWLNSDTSPQLQTVSSSGTYRIDPFETANSNIKGLKILKSIDPTTGVRTWYYIEQRTGFGFDGYLAQYNVQNGVVIHLGNDGGSPEIYQLDMTPETTSWYDSMLVTGRSYTDSAAGVVITTISADNSGALVQVSMTAQACTHANPTVTVTPAQTGWLSPGTPYTYTLTVTNNDSGACGAGDFAASATTPLGWSVGSSMLTLAPGATGSTLVNITSIASTLDGNYAMRILATNDSNGTYSAAASATYTVVSGLSVAETTNSSTYVRTQKATINATVGVLGSPLVGAPVTFTMTKPNGAIVSQNSITSKAGIATWVYTFNKRTDPTGTYRIDSVSTANGVTGRGTASFLVTK